MSRNKSGDLSRIDAVLTELRTLWNEAPEEHRQHIMVRIDAWLEERHVISAT